MFLLYTINNFASNFNNILFFGMEKIQKKATNKSKKQKKEVKHAKETDPKPPKRPQNGFFRYKDTVFQEYKEKHKDEKMGKISSLIGEAYRALTDDERKKFSDPYEVEMVQYRKVSSRDFDRILGNGEVQGQVRHPVQEKEEQEEEEGRG